MTEHGPDLDAIWTCDDPRDGIWHVPCVGCDRVVEISEDQAGEELAERVGQIDRIGWLVDKVFEAHESGRARLATLVALPVWMVGGFTVGVVIARGL